MSIEVIILISATLISLTYVIFLPKKKILQSQFVFLFVSTPSWILGLLVVEWGWIKYPIRELSSVNRTSFLFEYLVLPVICVLFNEYFPSNKSIGVRFGYYFIFTSTLTGIEYLLEKFTLVIKYTGWQWYWTWLSVYFIFWLTRRTVEWFFRLKRN